LWEKVSPKATDVGVFQGKPTPHSAGTPLIRLGAIAPIHLLPRGEKVKTLSKNPLDLNLS
jgi:hypothetical protein